MLDALRLDGQPGEEGWPYLAKLPANLADWRPPAITTAIFRRSGEQQAFAVDTIIQHLDRGLPVLILMYLSRSFFEAQPGRIVEGLPGEAPDFNRRHAVVAVAHGAVGAERVVMVRNSWGDGWGSRGYALLAEGFLQPRLFRLAILKEDLSVPTYSAAA
jgi:Papain family cysteine protease